MTQPAVISHVRPLPRVPPEGAGLPIIVSTSGGKDSTALILALREALDAGVLFDPRTPPPTIRYVFADTGWEDAATYGYLDLLRNRLGIEIDVVGVAGGMRERIRVRAGFPGRTGRFCTRELKIEPLREYHDRVIDELGVDDTISAIGVRGAESDERDKMPEWSDEGPTYSRDRWGGWVWRPLKEWTVDDVLLIHRRHGIPVNPLYQRGHDRVGCYPCIYASKGEIALIAKHAPERIDEIRALEQEMVKLRNERNAITPGRYAWPDAATFFQTRNGRRKQLCRVEHADALCRYCGCPADRTDENGDTYSKTVPCDPSNPDPNTHPAPPYHFEPFGDDCKPVRGLVEHTPMNIDDIVAWARTDDGGKQYSLFEKPPQGGCMKWGLCEAPEPELAEGLLGIPEHVHVRLDALEEERERKKEDGDA